MKKIWIILAAVVGVYFLVLRPQSAQAGKAPLLPAPSGSGGAGSTTSSTSPSYAAPSYNSAPAKPSLLSALAAPAASLASKLLDMIGGGNGVKIGTNKTTSNGYNDPGNNLSTDLGYSEGSQFNSDPGTSDFGYGSPSYSQDFGTPTDWSSYYGTDGGYSGGGYDTGANDPGSQIDYSGGDSGD